MTNILILENGRLREHGARADLAADLAAGAADQDRRAAGPPCPLRRVPVRGGGAAAGGVRQRARSDQRPARAAGRNGVGMIGARARSSAAPTRLNSWVTSPMRAEAAGCAVLDLPLAFYPDEGEVAGGIVVGALPGLTGSVGIILLLLNMLRASGQFFRFASATNLASLPNV